VQMSSYGGALQPTQVYTCACLCTASHGYHVFAAWLASVIILAMPASMPAAGANQNDDVAEQDSIRRVAEHLNAADSEAAVCIICLELLKRQDAVWSCTNGCCDTVHLACIQVRHRLLDICNSSMCNVQVKHRGSATLNTN
jgi:hypothetical protein